MQQPGQSLPKRQAVVQEQRVGFSRAHTLAYGRWLSVSGACGGEDGVVACLSSTDADCTRAVRALQWAVGSVGIQPVLIAPGEAW